MERYPICGTNSVKNDYRCYNPSCKAYSHKVLEEPLEEVCEECDGEGVQMQMVYYGGMPTEKYTTCENCDGEGVIYND